MDFSHSSPLYQTFINDHESYERYHIFLEGIRPTDFDKGGEGINQLKRFGFFGVSTSAYVTFETLGPDTGSSDDFPIGKGKSLVIKGTGTPTWDEKFIIIAKKSSTDSIVLKVVDDNVGESNPLAEFIIDRSDLPEAKDVNTALKEDAKIFVKAVSTGRMAGCEIVFSIKVTDCSSRYVPLKDIEDLYEDTDAMTYLEHTIEGKSEEYNSLLQCFRQPSSNKVVLWVMGRNDCFMHPHVAKKLFFENGYDVYVLNWKNNGCCRKKGWVKDPHWNTHNFTGEFDTYKTDIQLALKFISDFKKYEKCLGYAHSTGAPILINYLMNIGDAAFDGFCFNSPFLDWGHISAAKEFAMNKICLVAKVMRWDNNHKIDPTPTPESMKDTPLHYLNQDVVLSDWSCKIWSLYQFDLESRPIYKVPVTVGFARGVSNLFYNLKKGRERKEVITKKPFVMITSRSDDVLESDETFERTDWIGPNRSELILNDNGHDVFLAVDKNDTDMAIDMVYSWLKHRNFL